jgi:2-(1,2-epoxy-1,2-dihydrophenyl)acetyl-CoA isomerase
MVSVDPEQKHVSLVTEGGVAWITLNRPERLNAVGAQARGELDAALKQVERDAAVRCVVLTGAGRGFCAGADVRDMSGAGGDMRTPEEVGSTLRGEYTNIITRLRTMPKPVICAVNGVAAGIGASFAMACDIRIAAEEAYFSEAFVGIALAPDGGASWMLPRFVGRGRALEMFFTGKPLGAVDAERFGLVNRVVPAAELEETVRTLATELAAGPTGAIAAGKRAVNHAENSTLEEALEFESYLQEARAASPDFVEGVTAFREKRKANFKGI